MQTLTAQQLFKAAEHVIKESSFQEAAANSSKTFQNSGGYHRAVDEIFKFKDQTTI